MEASLKIHVLAAAFVLALGPVASAVPLPGRALPSVSVNDLGGRHHTERDLAGQWTIAFTMTDKDVGPGISAWWHQIEGRVPARTRMLSFVALDLFALVPTATILSQARDATPRSSWHTVWFSRDGSFAEQLGLPESETPWVFVIDPTGRVVESIHAQADAAGIARVLSAVGVRSASATP
jgi:hypothetical protein